MLSYVYFHCPHCQQPLDRDDGLIEHELVASSAWSSSQLDLDDASMGYEVVAPGARSSTQLDLDDAWIGDEVLCPLCWRRFLRSESLPQPAPEQPLAPKLSVPKRLRSSSHLPKPPPHTLKKEKGGAFGKLLLLGLIVAGGAFAYGTYHYQESPRQFGIRCTHLAQTLCHESPQGMKNHLLSIFRRLLAPTPTATPAPIPTPTPTPEATPTPTPEATPAPTPEATPAPHPETTAIPQATPDSVGWLIEHPEVWPKEVKLLQAMDFPVMIEGKVSGKATAPVGVVLPLLKVEREKLTVQFGGTRVEVPVAVTDLEERVPQAMNWSEARSKLRQALESTNAAAAKPTPISQVEKKSSEEEKNSSPRTLPSDDPKHQPTVSPSSYSAFGERIPRENPTSRKDPSPEGTSPPSPKEGTNGAP